MTQPEVFKYPTEMIDLPSKGWFYPEGHPLASGQVEMYYMTAKHEDILTSRNLIQKGVVIDKLLEALIVNKNIRIDDILLGDKSALMIAARVLGYGKEYKVSINCPNCSIKNEVELNLQDIEDTKCPYFINEYKNRNVFSFQLPISKKVILFKFLTHGDERMSTAELEGMRKVTKSEFSKEMTTRMKNAVVSVDGDDDREKIRQFVDQMPARDAMAFREHMKATSPDIDLTTSFTCHSCGYEGRVDIPIDVTFFWPYSRV